MFRFLTPALAAATLSLGLAAALPASAAPAQPSGIAAPAVAAQEVATRRQMRQRRAMRNRAMMRRSMNRPASAGNARNPSRPVMQQNQGQTTGGYR